MPTVYAFKLSTNRKRPNSTTPYEPMLIPTGEGEVMAVFSPPSSPERRDPEAAKRPAPMHELDPKCKVKMEVRTSITNPQEHECVLTFTVPLD